MTDTEKTKKLYISDPYTWEFEARVIEVTEWDGHPAVVLEKTYFYPEGGGQPSDRGTLNGIPVTDVQEEDERVYHVLEKAWDSSPSAAGRVDGGRRFDHMQQHAGQHILSQVFVELFDGATKSFHLGEEVSTLEIALKNITDEEIEAVEKRANAVVFSNLEIRSRLVDEKDIHTVPLRRPPQKAGLLRVIEIADFDYSACGGTHPLRTGEIGPIKIIKWDRIRGNLRFEFLCGFRAVGDYIQKNRSIQQIANSLTISDREVVAAFSRLREDLKELKKEMKVLRTKLLEVEAEEFHAASKGPVIQELFKNREADEIRTLALSLIRKAPHVVLFGLEAGERGHLVFARSDEIDIDLRQLVPMVSPLIDGRGGGQPSLVQMAGTRMEGLTEALDAAAAHIQPLLPSEE